MDKPTRLYLAGPMSGYPGHNVPLFLSVGAALRAVGYDVVIPCEGHADDADQLAKSWEEWMDIDVRRAIDCQAVAAMPGWEASAGATMECDLLLNLGRPVYDAIRLLHAADPADALLIGGAGPSRSTSLGPARLALLEWSRATFPDRQAAATRTHLHRELLELAETPTDRLEIADVAMLLFALADVEGVDIGRAVHAKLAIVRARTWGAPDGDGVREHVREEVAA